jgi:hypothetical protein
MSFKSVIDNVGANLKKFFTNPVVDDVVEGGITVAEIALPELDTVLTGLSKSFATATALAQSANTTGDTTAQVAALMLGDGQAIFSEYLTATNSTIETAQQKAVIAAFQILLANLPASTVAPAVAAPVVVPPIAGTVAAIQAVFAPPVVAHPVVESPGLAAVTAD